MDYMEQNWIQGLFWTRVHWSSFNLLLRTNNDREGLYSNGNKVFSVNEDNNIPILIIKLLPVGGWAKSTILQDDDGAGTAM